MAESRLRVAVFQKDSHYQVRLAAPSGRDARTAIAKLNIEPAGDALLRMDEYADLRGDDFFVSRAKELCFTCEYGRLLLIRSMVDELGIEVAEGEKLLPDTAEAEKSLAKRSAFADELANLMSANLPFYKRGAKSLLIGSSIRLAILIVVLVVGRVAYLQRGDHYETRSLQAIMKTAEEPYMAQGMLDYFLKPEYSHRSKLYVVRPLYIRGNNLMLEGGLFVKIEGIQNLKASLEAHGSKPLTIKVDTRENEMRVTGVFVGEDLIAPKGKLIYQGRVPVSGQPPMRVDALDTNSRGAYVRVRDADPEEEATFNWMLGQSISVIATLSSDGDRYVIGENDFKFAIPKSGVKPEIREILDAAAANHERAIVDMRLSTRAFPKRNRRDPRMQRQDTNILAEANAHFITVQGAVLKNI